MMMMKVSLQSIPFDSKYSECRKARTSKVGNCVFICGYEEAKRSERREE